LKFKSRRPRKLDQADPEFPGAGKFGSEFLKFPINATNDWAGLYCNPATVRANLRFRPGSAQGNFSAGAGNFFALAGNSSVGTGTFPVNDEFMPRPNVTPPSKCALANAPIPLKR
jgi:hypothetical protein